MCVIVDVSDEWREVSISIYTETDVRFLSSKDAHGLESCCFWGKVQ